MKLKFYIIIVCSFFIVNDNIKAAVFNVSNSTELQNALNTAASNGENDTINIASGTYSLTSALIFNSSENQSLTIIGSGNPILDGNSTVQVMNIVNFGSNATITIKGLEIKNGIADYGGGLYVETDLADILLQNCTLENNTGNIICGGANCYSNSGNISVESCTFTDNSAPNTSGYPNGTAGGLFAQTEDPGTTITLTDSYFSGNFAMRDAGGAMLYPLGSNSAVNAQNNTFDNNTANEFGGGCWIRCPGGDATVEYYNNILTQNAAQNAGSGGGTYIEIESGDINAGYNEHTGNSAIWDGAGLWIEDQNGTIEFTQNTFKQNQSSNNGGGINIYLADGTINISRNIFESNSAANIGGAMSLSTDSGTFNIYHNTTYSNTAGSEGGSVYFYFDQAASSASVYNNIFWNDSSPVIAYSGAQTVVATYSDISNSSSESWYGTGCIDADPLFADASNSDFHITWANYPTEDASKSPCIDSGDPSSPADPDGTIADMGRYCYDQTTLAFDVIFFEAKLLKNATVCISWYLEDSYKDIESLDLMRSEENLNWEILSSCDFQEEKSLSFIDKNPYNGINYYKLRIVFRDGFYFYSAIDSVLVNKTIEISILNPVTTNDLISFMLSNQGMFAIDIFNNNGRLLKHFNEKLYIKGMNYINFETNNISQGIYIIRFKNKNQTIAKRILMMSTI